MTTNTQARTNGMTFTAKDEAAVLDRLRRVLVRQTDEVAAAMGQGDAAWRVGLALLSDTAERTGARKLGVVVRHARRMDDPSRHARDRRHARAAFRRAARIDAGLAA